METPFDKIYVKEDESEFGEKHLPLVELEKQDDFTIIDVTVGSKLHPSEPGHFIQWVEILDGDVSLSKEYLTHFNVPKITCFVKKNPEDLKVRIFCNVHGTWEWEDKSLN